MSQSSSNSVVTIEQYLRKCFKQLFTALPTLEVCEKNSEKSIASLANLMEQRECTERVDSTNVVLLAKFPDLKERLRSKLSQEVDNKVEALKENLQPLREQKDLLCQAKEDLIPMVGCLDYDKGVSTAVNGTPTVPPLFMILDWIDILERHIREIYFARVFCLEDVAEQSVVNSDKLISLWMEDAHLLWQTLSDCQAHLNYFVKEKI